MELMIADITRIASVNADTRRQSGLHMKATRTNPSMATTIKVTHSMQTGLSRTVTPESMPNNHNHTHKPDVGVVGPEAVAEATVVAGVKDVVVVMVKATLQTEGKAAT
jgi:hypothetical protein